MRIAIPILLFLILLLSRVFSSEPVRENVIVNAVKKVKPGIVCIVTGKKDSTHGGSGIIISSNGYILTNSHTTQGAESIQVKLADGREYSAAIVGSEAEKDLAVIRIDETGLAVPIFGSFSALKAGQRVLKICNSVKYGWAITTQIVSSRNRDEKADEMYRDLILADTGNYYQSSCGVIINDRGEIVGIEALVYAGEDEHLYKGPSHTIPIDEALAMAWKLVRLPGLKFVPFIARKIEIIPGKTSM